MDDVLSCDQCPVVVRCQLRGQLKVKCLLINIISLMFANESGYAAGFADRDRHFKIAQFPDRLLNLTEVDFFENSRIVTTSF